MDFREVGNPRLREHHINRGHLSNKTSIDIKHITAITTIMDIPIRVIKVIINLKVITNIPVSRLPDITILRPSRALKPYAYGMTGVTNTAL
jgi:hypothetical protein